MVKAELGPQRSQDNDAMRELKLTCMDNLLATSDERVYFKDLNSRFLLVSAGWMAATAPDHSLEDVLGKTDFDFFSDEHATAALEDEQYIVRTGEPKVAKLERETFGDRASAWVSSTKMPLRDACGRIIGTFGISRDVTAQIKAENALAYQALHDPVTGLANRTALMDRLSQSLVGMDRHPGRVAVLFVDLDHFKEVNDTYGHDVGDRVLAQFGHRLTLGARRADTVARLGGDEFVVMCGELRQEDDVRLIADRFMRAMAAPYVEDGHELFVTCSIGISVTGDGVIDAEQLVHQADTAMYGAKRAGRNRFQTYDATQHADLGPGTLPAELRRAIEGSELFLVYQPLFSLETQLLIGVEALVRWRHPEHGVVLPNDFVPLAEQHGFIAKMGTFVLEEACRQLAEWTSRPGWPRGFTMAVNVSGRELSDPDFAARVAEVAARHHIGPAQLCLEITETALTEETGDVHQTLSALSKLGVRVALDDFGTGYSTLAHLQRLKVDILKIDRSFVTQVNRSPRDHEIVAAVTALSHALGMTVVGEGIETSHQLATLAALQCDEGQGFVLAHPMAPEEVVALVG